ncbi:MAG: hypothetical protein CSA68_06305 [Rhodobacterales bacterium]|nr:MAG: hypothetical protein CSA68_06305 [Rhodobacterales bacterium]
MALSYKARRRWALVVLVIGLPIYIGVALYVISLFDRPPVLAWYHIILELFVYIFLGFLWMLPLRSVFLGIGQPDPDAGQDAAESEKAD